MTELSGAPAPSSKEHLDVAALIARTGVVGAATYGSGHRVEGLAVCAIGEDGQEAVVDVGSADWRRAALAAHSHRRVLLFDDAKDEIGRLRREGFDVARPMCRRTLQKLIRQGTPKTDEPQAPLSDPPPPAADAAAATARARALAASCETLMKRVAAVGHHKVARLECLAVRAFAALENRGMPIDEQGWRDLVLDAKKRAASARTALFEALGDAVPRDLFGEPDLSLESDVDVKAVFERLMGERFESFTKHTLARIEHPAAGALLQYREAQKIGSTYGDAFLEHVRDGRIYARFLPLGASTGRVSSREPNLQNLPSDARFHHCLRAKPGFSLVTADYATCELRILADLSHDEAFLDAFAKGHDLHSAVASRLFKQKVTKDENPELRARAKAINFGLVYGMGAAALGSSLELSAKDAEALLARYFDAFPSVASYLEQSVNTALKRGYAETILGRKLMFDPAVVRGPNARGELGRIAKNMPIQGTSADMTKLAMVMVHERLQDFADAGLVNSIHDELVVECREEDGDAVAIAVREEMEAAHCSLLKKAPPSVDVHVGPHWAH